MWFLRSFFHSAQADWKYTLTIFTQPRLFENICFFIFTQSGLIQNIYTQLRLVVNVEYKKHTFCNPLPWRKLKFWIFYPQVILGNVGWEGGIQDLLWHHLRHTLMVELPLGWATNLATFSSSKLDHHLLAIQLLEVFTSAKLSRYGEVGENVRPIRKC